MTGTPTPPLITEGFEYNIVPGAVFDSPTGAWNGVHFDDLPSAIELNGFRVAPRRYSETCTQIGTDPEGNPIYNCIRTYPQWEMLSQTLVKSSPSRQVFDTDNGDELFVGTPGIYTGFADPAGIKDGTKYVYVRVFDQSDISYIPRASTINQPVITQPTTMPSDDEEYLVDTICSFIPDERESVTIQYTLTTEWTGGTDVMTISQTVTQDTGNAASKLKAFLERSYYNDGKYHIQLHDMDEPDLYDSGGELIRPEAYKVPVYKGRQLQNSVTPVTPNDILGEIFGTSVDDLQSLVNMIDDYEFPEI